MRRVEIKSDIFRVQSQSAVEGERRDATRRRIEGNAEVEGHDISARGRAKSHFGIPRGILRRVVYFGSGARVRRGETMNSTRNAGDTGDVSIPDKFPKLPSYISKRSFWISWSETWHERGAE